MGWLDNTSQRSKGEGSGIACKDRHSIYQNGTTEPCYFSSSIYYGGQEMYSPTGQTTGSQPIGFKVIDHTVCRVGMYLTDREEPKAKTGV
ncbi:hypothetical protein F0562_011137 [Nyssa sinensis]|uniref:Uncharacterized protein n=1 Tax=Nyssa sinensis TaxID=561372 RepID=A0A5J5A3D2_9ASTE|nr:hypothetical protein F0562_011137 [Nyssa sinensis]